MKKGNKAGCNSMDISTQSVLAIQLWEALVDMETTNPKVYLFPLQRKGISQCHRAICGSL